MPNLHFKPGLVSVMMPAYNARAFIDEAIASVLAQTYQSWELIIVNDGSTDATGEIAGAYDDPRIVLIHQENGGESVARNTALDHMRGEFVAFLDADDIYEPDHLALAIAFLQQHPDMDGVYTDGRHIDQAGAVGQTLSSRRRGPFTGRIFEEVVRASDVFGPPACVALRRRGIVDHDLRFDTDIVIGPDWDFLTRFCEHSRFGYIDQSTCLYRIHDTNISVQIDLARRAQYLARCREKAIQLPGFGDCSDETRVAVFYDLLINLLAGYPQRQHAISLWPQFAALPDEAQARLLRLMGSKAMERGQQHEHISTWLHRSRTLSPSDRRSLMLSTLYNLSPALCGLPLRARTRIRPASSPSQQAPFADMV